ncbi:unnamed protein product [Peronospora effusa]|nr:unnamed protein product [Peronospora effusa]
MKVISTIISASLLIGSVTGLLCGLPVSPEGAFKDRRLQKEDKAKYVLVGGLYFFGGDEADLLHEVVDITKCPQSDGIYSSNFAVLKLKNEVKDDIKPVNLPTHLGTGTKPGTIKTALGWGPAPAGGNVSVMLLKLDQQLISNENCHNMNGLPIGDMSYMCTGSEEGKGPCIEDAGAPLIHENSKGDNDDVLIGLLSGGPNICGMKESPSIYSNVSLVVDWIITTMKA